jgi:DNA ligase (NAD+)
VALWGADEWALRAIRDVGDAVVLSIKRFIEQHPDLPTELCRRGLQPDLENGIADGVSLGDWILNLPLEKIGDVKVKTLIQQFQTVDAIWSASLSEISHLDKWKLRDANTLMEFIQQHSKLPLQLIRIRFAQLSRSGVEDMAHPLTGKTVVLTGTLPTLTRDEAKERLIKLGGKVSGTISKKTDFLLAGAEAGSKLSQAMDLGVPIKDEEWLLKMAAGGK